MHIINFQQTFHFLKKIFHNKLQIPVSSFIWKISLYAIFIDNVWSLVMSGVADVDRFKCCILNAFGQVSPPPQINEA